MLAGARYSNDNPGITYCKRKGSRKRGYEISCSTFSRFLTQASKEETAVTARELLDEKRKENPQRDLKDQPEVQAAMMDTMGQVYSNLGLFDTAIPLLEKALEIRKRTLDSESPEIASTMNNLGVGASKCRKA